MASSDLDCGRSVAQYISMSAYHVDLVAINPKQEDIRSAPVRVLVDTGSELSCLPRDVLAGAGIPPRRKRLFRLADGSTM